MRCSSQLDWGDSVLQVCILGRRGTCTLCCCLLGVFPFILCFPCPLSGGHKALNFADSQQH